MRPVLGLLLAAACAEPLEQEVFGDVDGTPFLAEGEELAEAFEDRVRTVATPRARLTPDGPELPPPTEVSLAPLVVVDPGPWPRVGMDVFDLRVLAYVDRGSLERRVVADPPGPVRLPMGQVVEVLEENEDEVHVVAKFRRWTAVPWLPSRTVDEVWTEDPPQVERALPDGEPVWLRAGTELLDAPGGRLVGWTEADELPLAAVELAETDGDSVRVAFQDSGASVEAWVLAEDLIRELTAFGFRSSCGGGYSMVGRMGIAGPTAHVPAGTLLTAGPGGPVVALALEDLLVPDDALEEGAFVARDTPVGRVEVWVEAADVVP